MSSSRVRLVAMGASWGGVAAATEVLSALPSSFPAPLILVQHQRMAAGDRLASLLASRTALHVVSVEQGDRLEPGYVYVAPPGYHTLVEPDGSLSLGLHSPVHYCRPAIDELLYSAADTFGSSLLAVILTGANEDGAAGLGYARRRGGTTVVQEPSTAEAPVMPEAAIALGAAGHVLPLQDIGKFLTERTFGLQA